MKQIWNLLLEILFSNWPIVGPVVYELIVRIWPTKWNLSILDAIWKVIGIIIPNKRKTDGTEEIIGTNSSGALVNKIKVRVGRHIVRVLIPLFLLCSFASQAQIWQNYKGVRLVNESDTAQQLAIQGSLFFDDVLDSLYLYDGTKWQNLSKGYASQSSGAFWPLSGTGIITNSTNIQVASGGSYGVSIGDSAGGTSLYIDGLLTSISDIAGNSWSLDGSGISYSGNNYSIGSTNDINMIASQDLNMSGTNTVSIGSNSTFDQILFGSDITINSNTAINLTADNVPVNTTNFVITDPSDILAKNQVYPFGFRSTYNSLQYFSVEDQWIDWLGTGITDISIKFPTNLNFQDATGQWLRFLGGTNQILQSNVAGTATTSIFGGEIQFDIPASSDDLTLNATGINSSGLPTPFDISSTSGFNITSGAGSNVSISGDVVSISGDIDLAPNTNGSELYGDTYSPILTNQSNISASNVIAGTVTYTRVENVVYVQMGVNVTVTSNTTLTQLGIQLPIPSPNLSTISGTAVVDVPSGAAMNIGFVTIDSINDIARLQFTSASTGAQFWYLNFQYIVEGL